MRRAILSAALPVLGVALIASSARAGSGEDGNAGLDALNRGSYSEAVRLFTRAIKAGDLAKDDQEFAYLNRGKAYLAEGKKTLAVADFKKAASLKPDDTEAQTALQSALYGAVAHAAAPSPPTVDPDTAWGPVAAHLDTYWMEVDTAPVAYSICHWQTPHRLISCEGLGKNGKQYASTYELDPSTGAITYKETLGTPFTAAVEVHGDSYAIDIESNGKYLRQTYSPIDATSGQVAVELYDNGAWKTLKTEKSVQASPEQIQALGWRVGKDKTHSFWKDLGNAIVQDAAASLVQGLQPQPQQ